jgi:hypothetical protein
VVFAALIVHHGEDLVRYSARKSRTSCHTVKVDLDRYTLCIEWDSEEGTSPELPVEVGVQGILRIREAVAKGIEEMQHRIHR